MTLRFLRSLLFLILTVSASAQTIGQYELRKRGASGFTSYGITLSNGQVIGQTAGIPAAITPLVSGDLSAYLTAALAASTYQPLDSDLNIFAAITPSSNVQSLLSAANYAAAKTLLSLNAVENTALSTWAGTANLTTLGTITTGTWNGSIIAPAYLGTGSSISTKYLRGDGTWQALDLSAYQTTAGTLALAGFSSITGTLADGNIASAATWNAKAGSTANTFTRLQTITQGTANEGIIATTGYSLTGSNASSLIDLAGTWNTSGTPTAIKLNVTNTASNAAALLMDLQVGAASKWKVAKNGVATMSVDAAYAGDLTLVDFNESQSGGVKKLYLNVQTGSAPQTMKLMFQDKIGYTGGFVVNQASSNGYVGLESGGNGLASFSLNTTGLASLIKVGGAQGYAGYEALVQLSAESSDVLMQRRSSNAQVSRVAKTYTSSTSWEAGVMDWQTTADVLRIGSDVGSGGGTARDVRLIRGGVVKETLGANTTDDAQPRKLPSYIVSGLPSASTCGAGSCAFVTDANATTTYTTVAGGGSNKVLVISDGTNWIIH